jgi:hypothetical protein
MRTHVCQNSTQLAVTQTASDDLALVHASKSGDVAAFEELVKRYDRKLLRKPLFRFPDVLACCDCGEKHKH